MTTVTMSVGEVKAAGVSKAALWTGRILSGLVVAFLAFDAIGKLLLFQQVVEGSKQIGFGPDVLVPLGAVLAAFTLLFAVPRTAVLGAVLLTAYLGGAVACQVVAKLPLASNVLFPVYFATILWVSLFLRDPRVRAMISAPGRG